MKTIILTLIAMTAYAGAVSITTPVEVISNEMGAPYHQTLVFDLAWGGEPVHQDFLLPGGHTYISRIRFNDWGIAGGVGFSLFMPAGGVSYEFFFGPYSYAEDPMPFVGRANNHPAFAVAWELSVEPVPGEPMAGRFTYVSSANGQHSVPDGGSTALMLLAVLGLLLPWRGREA